MQHNLRLHDNRLSCRPGKHKRLIVLYCCFMGRLAIRHAMLAHSPLRPSSELVLIWQSLQAFKGKLHEPDNTCMIVKGEAERYRWRKLKQQDTRVEHVYVQAHASVQPTSALKVSLPQRFTCHSCRGKVPYLIAGPLSFDVGLTAKCCYALKKQSRKKLVLKVVATRQSLGLASFAPQFTIYLHWISPPSEPSDKP